MRGYNVMASPDFIGGEDIHVWHPILHAERLAPVIRIYLIRPLSRVAPGPVPRVRVGRFAQLPMFYNTI